MKIRNIISAAAACAIAATAFVMPASAEETYKAAITFQSASFVYRNTLTQPSTLVWDNELGEPADYEGASFVDAEITGNGTYAVELSGIADEGGWNMLKVDTTIDLAKTPDVVLTITGLELDGAAADFDATAAAMIPAADASQLASDEYSAEEFSVEKAARFQLINTYDKVAAIDNKQYDSIKVTFEVSGLPGGEEAPAEGGEQAPADNGVAAPADDKGSPDGGKGSPDTGVEGVAVVAGAAILAGGVVLLSKKKK